MTHTETSPHILLTYFGAFEGVDVNPTDRIAHLLSDWFGEELVQKAQLSLVELPVAFGDSTTALEEAIAKIQPTAVISLGVAVGRDKVSLERVAINLDDARIADNKGRQLRDTPIVEDGAAAYFSSLPVREIFEEARTMNLPVELSYSAGTYVCNHVFYSLMHAVRDTRISAGFIHIPAIDFGDETSEEFTAHAETGGVEGKKPPQLGAEEALRVLQIAVEKTLG